jgi:hypothetical protein
MVEQTLLSPVTFNGKTISLAEMYIQSGMERNGMQSKYKSIQFVTNARIEKKISTRVKRYPGGDVSRNISKAD